MKATIIFIASLIEIALCAWAAMLATETAAATIALIGLLILGTALFVIARLSGFRPLFAAVPLINSMAWGALVGLLRELKPADNRTLCVGAACAILTSLAFALWSRSTARKLIREIGIAVIILAAVASVCLTIYAWVFEAIILCLFILYFKNFKSGTLSTLAITSFGLPALILIIGAACIDDDLGEFVLELLLGAADVIDAGKSKKSDALSD